METLSIIQEIYFDIIPKELALIILDKLYEYIDIINYGKLLLSNGSINNNDISIILKRKFNSIYDGIFEVLNDDLTYKENGLLDFYATFISYFQDVNFKLDFNNISEIMYYLSVPAIMHRAIFNIEYPDLYLILKELESFTSSNVGMPLILKKNVNKEQYTKTIEYGIPWKIIYDILFYRGHNNINDKNMELLLDILLYQSDCTSILHSLMAYEFDENIISYFGDDNPFIYLLKDHISEDFMVELIHKSEKLFKYLYINQLYDSAQSLSYIENSIITQNYSVLAWLISNGEDYHLNNCHFDERFIDVENTLSADDYNKILKILFK